MAQSLLELPLEMRHHILSFVDPEDLPRISFVCKELRQYLKVNKQLDRDIVLRVLDGPCSATGRDTFDYRQFLRDSVTFRKLLGSTSSIQNKVEHINFISDFATKCLKYASPKDSPNLNLLNEYLEDLFTHKDNIEAFLCQSSTFARAKKLIDGGNNDGLRTYEEQQASARLHVQYGLAQMCPNRYKYKRAYGFAASVVYDLRNYRMSNFWGPFRNTGDAAVDWEKMEAVMLVLFHNLKLYRDHTGKEFRTQDKPFSGATPGSFVHRPLDLPHKPPRTLEDPYGLSQTKIDPYNVSGTWMRVVCFLDFHDLFAYNFTMGQPPPGQPRPDINTTEAIRVIKMEIQATRFEKPEEGDGQDLPVVHFEGVSRSLHDSWDPNANSSIRGTVRLTKEGEVRWSTISVYGGEERWRSEGVQVGGIDSARGTLGYWFDKDHGHHGPAGPTMFWKVSNDITESMGSPYHQDPDDDDDEDLVAYETGSEDEVDGDQGQGQGHVFVVFGTGLLGGGDEDEE